MFKSFSFISDTISRKTIELFEGYMAQSKNKLRLDQILMYEGLINEEQVKKALKDQKESGGKFGSQLLYNRFIDETALIRALAKQLNCKAVVLTNLAIPEIILKLIPPKFAVARKVIPFSYDVENDIIKFACEDPTDDELKRELQFVTKNQKIELYLAADLVLNTSIAKYYLDYDIGNLDNYLLELPKVYDEYLQKQLILEKSGGIVHTETKEIILLVSDDLAVKQLLVKLFESDGFKVITKESADDAIQILGQEQFHSVYISDRVVGDYIDLIDRLRKNSPKTKVRYYDSVTSLFLGESEIETETELLIHNLDLFTSLLVEKENLEYNHNSIVGQYVKKLCAKISLPQKDRLAIINAAYLHDISKYFYPLEKNENEDENIRSQITKTVKLLSSLNYSPVIIEMLKSMYIDLQKKYTKRLPIEVLGGNIITICDLFCQHINIKERLSFDKFDLIQTKIKDLTGDLFLEEVAHSFIEMIKDEIMSDTQESQYSQTMIFYTNEEIVTKLEDRLKLEHFRILTTDSSSSMIELYKRSKPDFILLCLDCSVDEIKNHVTKLDTLGLNFKDTTTFILAQTDSAAQLSSLFTLGIEDIISLDGNLEFLIAKMKKIQSEFETNSKDKDIPELTKNTHGLLADIDIIDLIQMMGGSNRTAKLTVLEDSDTDSELLIYFGNGKITYASFQEKNGADAVYHSIGWKQGSWQIETINISELPTPNNELPNESILMEGCRLLDETKRVQQNA